MGVSKVLLESDEEEEESKVVELKTISIIRLFRSYNNSKSVIL